MAYMHSDEMQLLLEVPLCTTIVTFGDAQVCGAGARFDAGPAYAPPALKLYSSRSPTRLYGNSALGSENVSRGAIAPFRCPLSLMTAWMVLMR